MYEKNKLKYATCVYPVILLLYLYYSLILISCLFVVSTYLKNNPLIRSKSTKLYSKYEISISPLCFQYKTRSRLG